ncbi:MAG: serine/threonine-protein kinase, partial [Lentisphaerota bacterium]
CGVEIEVDGGIAGSLVQCPNCKYNLMLPVQGIRQGMKIAGYEIISRLGAGGMGEVWLAKQTAMDRKVALKILPSALTSDKDFVDRFLKEVKNAAKLEHQNIVTSFDAGVDGNIYYLAMSYVDGVLLDDRLSIDRKIPEKEALQIIRCVADALCYAWNEFKILHRDIKPANIMIDSRKIPKLLDMGISKSLSEEKKLTITGMIIGTPYYMSPEQARADTDIDCRSDIYSLGSSLYHLVAGEVPYDATTAMGILTKHITEPFPPPQNKNPEVSDECSVLLEAMMAKRPDDRPKTWEDVIMDIDLVLSGKFPSTKRPEIGKSLVLQETPSQKSGRQKTLQQFQKTEVLEKNGLTTGFQSCRKKNEHGKRLSTVLIAAGITLSVIIISLIALTLFIGKDKKSASEKAPAPALPESAKSGAVSPEIMEKVRQARTKTGKVIRVSPDGKTEGTLDPETAAKQLEPGTILRFGKEWKKGQNVKSEWGGVFPKVSCTDIIIESESPISITLPPKSILRNSKVFILSFSGEATIVDSKIFTTRGIQEKEEVIIHNCEILSGLSQLRKLN